MPYTATISEPQSVLGLGLNKPTDDIPAEEIPTPESLQFRKAETVSEVAGAQVCRACKRSFASEYFHVNGIVVCPACTESIESRQKAPPVHSMLKAFVYGLGAAIAGSILYAAMAIITGLELALIAILIGYMVGKAIRYASNGLGGRPQQILAVALTYFSITTSYIPVAIHHFATNPPKAESTAQPSSLTGAATDSAPAATDTKAPRMSLGQVIGPLLLLALGAPFLALGNFSGIISLLIIFFGLKQAWKITGRSELVITGPYGT